jgi:predicted YcjX-like family ATPase
MPGHDLPQFLAKNSDFTKKLGLPTDEIPQMLFDEHNCDLYDNVRPIKWTDPAEKVSECRVSDQSIEQI